MKQPKTYSDKLRACNHEALITIAVLALIVVLWWVFGYGLSRWDVTAGVTVLGMPLWAVAGTVGTWIVAIVAAVVLSHVFFKDFDFEEEKSIPDASTQDAGGDGTC